MFSESPDPRQWPHVATGLTYRRAMRELASILGCEPGEDAVYAHRLATDSHEYSASLLRASNTEMLLVDDGYPCRSNRHGWQELGELASCQARPVMRIEQVAEEGSGSRRATRSPPRSPAPAAAASSASRRSPRTAPGSTSTRAASAATDRAPFPRVPTAW